MLAAELGRHDALGARQSQRALGLRSRISVRLLPPHDDFTVAEPGVLLPHLRVENSFPSEHLIDKIEFGWSRTTAAQSSARCRCR